MLNHNRKFLDWLVNNLSKYPLSIVSSTCKVLCYYYAGYRRRVSSKYGLGNGLFNHIHLELIWFFCVTLISSPTNFWKQVLIMFISSSHLFKTFDIYVYFMQGMVMTIVEVMVVATIEAIDFLMFLISKLKSYVRWNFPNLNHYFKRMLVI